MYFCRMKFLRVAVLAAVLLISAGTLSALPRGYVISPRNAENIVTEKELLREVEFLSDSLCEGRRTGSPGSVRAASMVARKFEAAGVKPLGNSYFHTFSAGENAAHNVMGIIPGFSDVGHYIVVTAHYDGHGHLGGNFYPGADSNASGVVAMLTVGDMVARMNRLGKVYGKGLILVALDAKNRNLGGAKHLLDQLRSGSLTDPSSGKAISLADIDLLINIDQVGSSLSPISKLRKDYLLMLSDESGGRRDALLGANRSGVRLDLGFDYYGSKDFTKLFFRKVSDQAPFLDAGVPSVMFTSGITMLNNKPQDTPDSLDIPVLKKRIILIFNYLVKIL